MDNSKNYNRNDILKRYQELIKMRDDYLYENADQGYLNVPEDAETVEILEESVDKLDDLAKKIVELKDVYRDNLPSVKVSRCPYTGKVLEYPIDVYGLDGLWWDYFDPVRKEVPQNETFVALTGAIKLNLPVEDTPFLVETGPEVPYVLPALLEQKGVLAVLSSIKIGKHTAFITAYFSPNPQEILIRPNFWGTNYYTLNYEREETGWVEEIEEMKVRDFDLEPWIESGKLFWIHPGDEKFNLRADLQACPYLNLEGNTNTLMMQFGEIIDTEEDADFLEYLEEELSSFVDTEDNESDFEDIESLFKQYFKADELEDWEKTEEGGTSE